MSKTQIVTITFFRYEGFKNKWWGFTQMGAAGAHLEKVEGLNFVKMFGSGADNGFSVYPNFGVYGLLSVWKNETTAHDFFDSHSLFQEFKNRCKEYWTIFMNTNMVHGSWDAKEPFQVNSTFDKTALVGVITRATIKTKHLFRFWKFVPRVSRSVDNKKGRLFSVGIGELPIVQQATFSLWENSELMMEYAYKSKYHKEVVEKTRSLGWYKEELFARFSPYKTEGTWEGGNPLDSYL